MNFRYFNFNLFINFHTFLINNKEKKCFFLIDTFVVKTQNTFFFFI